ncbi:DExH-box ATP-dependent RNA helicase DExH6-like isoform X2 [Phoenix dactylifera]|uniref:DExH-box ATP-dependent RNA helicase DExH6-like isoform X2 n=1 Tax=Phoenix dactylifera TaxID=42345 RepID=A0A8B7CUH4_PHODC|nr:DExH-box ATP-dependent RNA helicase DExH6-like isoform X2 [Phoenix dactylifera]
MGRKGQKKGNGGEQQPVVVTEATRIQIGKILEEFRVSDAKVYTFEPGLSKHERAAIHEMCRKIGMISKSSGYGERRCLSVYKNRKKQGAIKNEEETVTCLKFSEETKNVLRDLFTRFPPDDGELREEALRSSSKKAGKRQWKQDSSFFKPSMHKSEIAKKVDQLTSKINGSAQLKKIMEDRAKLPIASFKDVITSTLETNQVVLISGATGCGKTTQVPQYILDHMWAKGEACKIVCTQPRRISAISVAERIAYERGETIGENVGYKIRLESQGGKNSSIMFCTNGVLLRLLISRGANSSKAEMGNKKLEDGIMGITHIIVDEIHERDRFSDFMLAILRDILPSYPHLRMVLMSATIDAERFSQYFNGCPIIQVPGFTYPVKTFYLEDVLSILKSTDDNHLDRVAISGVEEGTSLTEDYKNALDESINLALSNDEFDPLLELISSEQTPKVYNYQHSLTGVSPLMVFAGKGRIGDVCMLLSFGADCSLCAQDGSSALDWAQQENQLRVCEILKKHIEKDISKSAEEEELLGTYLASINPEHVDTVLIERLLRKICTDSKEGAILVFLPGWDDINQIRERLLASPFFRDPLKFVILSLHSMIPSAEQKKVFKCPPVGARKIILSTNIAETAVTIDDVVYVINSGRMKEKSYDPYNNVSTLQSSWVSKASARQREGRAGRCQPGTCYHLYSRTRAASLPEYQVPEIKRMPIEELCLQVKLLDPDCGIVDFLQRTLDPPVPETIRNAIIVLQDIGALTDDEKLTDLGEKLGSLPVHPSTSKMLLFAILMNCLDPALTLACASDYREPFILPMAPDERKRAAAAKVELASLYGGYSDQLAIVAAFDCWKRAKDRGQESQFCSKYFISSNTMNMLSNMRKQLQSELARNGFVPSGISNCSLNAQDPGILRAVLMAGTYPMVGRLLPPRKNSGKRAIVETASGAKVRLHPHSLNFNLSFSKSTGSPLIIYDEVTRGDGGMYIKNCSLAGPYPLLLLAMEMVVAPADDDDESDEDEASSGEEDEMEMNTSSGKSGEEIMSSPDNTVSVVVDRWLRFESTALDVAQIYCLRERLSTAILFKVLLHLSPLVVNYYENNYRDFIRRSVNV